MWSEVEKNWEVDVVAVTSDASGESHKACKMLHEQFSKFVVIDCQAHCQVRVYSGKGSGQVRTETDEGREQRAGQEVSPAGVGDRMDSTTKDNERWSLA